MNKITNSLILSICFILIEVQIHSQELKSISNNSNSSGILIDNSNQFSPEYFQNNRNPTFNQALSQIPVYSSINFWYQLNIDKQTKKNYIEIYCPNIKEVHLFAVINKNDSDNLKSNHIIVVESVIYGNSSVTAHIPLNASIAFIKLNVSKFKQFEIKLFNESDFFKKERILNVFYGFSFGIIILIFLYHLIIFFKVRENLYLYYLLQIFISAIILFFNNHLIAITYHSFLNELANDIFQISAILLCIAFLKLSKQKRWTYFLLLSFLPLIIFLRFLDFLRPSQFINIFIHIESILLYLSISVISIIYSFRNHKSNHLFIYPWLLILIAQILYSLNQFQVLSLFGIGIHAGEIGIMLNIILLALTFGNKLNIYKSEKIFAESNEVKALIAKDTIIQEQNEILKNLIQERNKEIIDKIATLSLKKEEIETQNNQIRSSNEELDIINQRLSIKNIEIAEYNKELEKLNESLELKVNKRTKKLIKAKNKAIVADKLKTSLLTNLDLEINMLMNSISGFSSMLYNSGYTKEQRNEFLSIINYNIEILLDSIDNMVLLARIQTNLTKPKISHFYINKLFLKLTEYAENNLNYSNKNLRLKIDYPQLTQNLVVQSDYDKIWQIIIKLLTFATYHNTDVDIYLGLQLSDILDTENKTKLNFNINLQIIYNKPDEEKLNWMLVLFHQKTIDKNKFTKINEIGVEITWTYVEILGAKIEASIINKKDISITIQIPVTK